MAYTERPDAGEYGAFYAGYVARVPEGDIVATLATQAEATLALLRGLADSAAGHRYAPGKWSIREVLGHMADTERVFAYRLMRFARGDATALPGFDENAWMAPAEFDARTLPSLLAEFAAVRNATVALLAGLPADAWTRGGTASGHHVSVRALAWMTAGHELHHRQILEARYLATLPA
jgi:uncharacterized damage-inducible protein DinB